MVHFPGLTPWLELSYKYTLAFFNHTTRRCASPNCRWQFREISRGSCAVACGGARVARSWIGRYACPRLWSAGDQRRWAVSSLRGFTILAVLDSPQNAPMLPAFILGPEPRRTSIRAALRLFTRHAFLELSTEGVGEYRRLWAR